MRLAESWKGPQKSHGKPEKPQTICRKPEKNLPCSSHRELEKLGENHGKSKINF